MNWRGTAPPTTLSTNSKPPPSGSGSTSMSQMAYWPWPPDCLTWRPCPLAVAGERLAQRHDHVAPLDARRRSARCSRSSATSAWASPITQSTSWPGLRRSARSAGSGPRRASRPSAEESLSSSDLVAASIATGSSGVGIDHGLSTRGWSDAGEGVAGLGPRQPADRGDVAGDHPVGRHLLARRTDGPARRSARPRRGPRGRSRRRRTTRSGRRRARDWSGSSVPEKTRTTLTRPTYGSLVVFTTSATSGRRRVARRGAGAAPRPA